MAELALRDFVPERTEEELLSALRERVGAWAVVGQWKGNDDVAGMWLTSPRCHFCGQETVWWRGSGKVPWNGVILDADLGVLSCQVCATQRGVRRRQPGRCPWPECSWGGRPHDHTPYELGEAGRRKRLDRRRDAMFAADPRCHWCSELTVRVTLLLPTTDADGRAALRRAAPRDHKPGGQAQQEVYRQLVRLLPSFDHLYPSWDPRRAWHEYDGVLAHAACNHHRGRIMAPFNVKGEVLIPHRWGRQHLPDLLAAAYERKRLALLEPPLPAWRQLLGRMLAWLRQVVWRR